MKYSNSEIYCILLQGTCLGGQRYHGRSSSITQSFLLNAAIIILLSLSDLFMMEASFPKEESVEFYMGRKEQRETISSWIFDLNSYFGL